MKPISRVGLLSVVLALACASEKGAGQDVTPDTGLPTCPDETELTELPCDCYGHVVYDPNAQVPGCKTRVVCCPAVKDLRCEDHELLDVLDVSNDAAVAEEAPNSPDEAMEDASLAEEAADETSTVEEISPDVAPEVTYPKCPYEVDLSKATLPCDCKGTIVFDVKHALPDCTKKVVCCPYKGLVCE